MSLGIKSSAFLRVFTMGSWIHHGFLDSRWVLGFTMGSWVHDKVHAKSLDFFESCAKAAKHTMVFSLGWFGTDFKTFFGFVFDFYSPFGVRRGLKMILRHRLFPVLISAHTEPYGPISDQFSWFSYIWFFKLEKLLASGTCPRQIHQRFTIDSR